MSHVAEASIDVRAQDLINGPSPGHTLSAATFRALLTTSIPRAKALGYDV